jgi:5'-methylthioadenosine phosphorylase
MFAIIAGSGAHDLLRTQFGDATRIGPRATPFGESQPVYRLAGGGGEFHLLLRHGEGGYSVAAPFVNYRANIYALRDLGVTRVVAWSGPGAIDLSLRPGQYVVPDDLIDQTVGRASTFFEGTGLGFIRQWPVFCPELHEIAARALTRLGLMHKPSGTYVCTRGPRLETPAEIRMFRALGADLVGMTLCPEVFLARELEMCYAAVCYVTNYAEGLRPSPQRPGYLFEGLLQQEEWEAVGRALEWLPKVMREIEPAASGPRGCECGRSMERYRRRGDVGEDWREWVGGEVRE